MSEEQAKRHPGIYLLPNLFTTGALFAGFYAIIAANEGKFEAAAIAVFIAMVLDGLDGRVARMTNTQSAFGAEYDSLSDMVSFGLAPALVMYEWSLFSMKAMGFPWDKIAWLAAFFYVASAALRLARFNTRIGVQDKRWFQGLPSPAAAAVLMGMIWTMTDMGFLGSDLSYLAIAVTLIPAFLMVSNIPFYSFKDINFKNRVSFVTMPIVVILLVLATIDPSKILWAAFSLYAISGIIMGVFRLQRKISRKVNAE